MDAVVRETITFTCPCREEPEGTPSISLTCLACSMHTTLTVTCLGRPCECDPSGSVGDCSPSDGGCDCKANVEGQSCSRFVKACGVIVHVSHIFVNPIFSCLSVDCYVLNRNKGMRSRSCSLPLPELFLTCARFMPLPKVLPVVFLQISRIIEQGPPLMHGDMF